MFEVIAGSGHCGTKWLATVLDSLPGRRWLHHYREEVTGQPWERLDLLYPWDNTFMLYWADIRGFMNDGGHVGDSNSWPPHLLPLVHRKQPIDRVIYLTRNGIQQLHSLMTTSPALRRHPLPRAADMKLKRLHRIGYRGHRKYSDLSRFERLCLLVAANDFMPAWLISKGLNVEVYSLETLTTDGDALRELAPGVNPDDWMNRDINRHVEGARAEADIWRSWDADQQAAYKEIIG